MKLLLNVALIVLVGLCTLSCTPSAPYEIKSPCVSIDPGASDVITPCVRRPVNISRAIV